MKARGSWVFPLALAIIWLTAIVAYLIRQAVPVGGLEGIALAEETGRPLPRARIQLSFLDATTDEAPSYFDLRTKRDGSFGLARIPAGRYRLEASSRAHRLRPTSVTVEEGKVRQVTLELGPVAPYFSINIAQNTVTPEEKPQVIAHGFLHTPTLEFQLHRVDPAVLLGRHYGSLRGVLRSEEPPEHLVIEGNPALTPAGRSSAQITQRDAEGIFHQRFDLPAPPPGIYLVVAKADSIQQMEWVVVTRLGLILKRWGSRGLAYVTDLTSGDPISGARVEFSALEGGTVSGTTGEDGIFQAQLPAVRPGVERRLLARAEKDDSQAFLVFYSYGEDGRGQERVYCYTDRPVYRPGHLVHFKGIARRFADDQYTVPADRPVETRVWDSRESLVYRGRLRTNSFGSFHGEFRLNEEAATGLYRVVNVLDGREHDSYFKVAEYRKPEYTVSVTTSKRRYVRGETVEVRASAQYYFGAPVAGAEVSYLVRRSPYWFYPRGEEDEESDLEEYGYDYGEVIEQGTARTDAEGKTRFRVPTKPPLSLGRQREAEEAAGQDCRYTIEVTVTDPSRKAVTGSGSTLVTQGEFRLYLRPGRYIAAPGQEVEVEVSAVDYESRPVGGVRVDLAAGWHSWRETSRFEAEARGQVTTDAKGRATFRFTPEGEGTYRVEGQARDRLGNRILDTGYLWVTSSDHADFAMPYPDLEIVADRRVYRAGETAVLLINSKLKGATALVTVEGPELYQHNLVKLVGGSTRVELPVKPEYAPNFFFCVSLVRNKQFAIQQKRIKVSIEERQLQVAVEPDKQLYRPGEEATYRIRTADWQGKPIPAELSVGVVDESIYAIQEEMAEPVLRFFYPPRYNSVDTSYSFAQIYLDADKEPVGIKVRKRFPDTAYWNPTVVTGRDGEASISFEMPDTLTTWRTTVRGATLATAVGEAVTKVKCSKDLLVRLEMPRFLTQKDKATIAAVAHNYTKAKQGLELWLTAPGLSFGRRPEAGERLRFGLAPEGTRRQDWQVEATAPGDRELTAFLKAESGLSDAMALTLPVLPHGRERVEWRSGTAVNTATERLPVRADSVRDASVLRVRLAPSIASVLLGALEYLAAYPYGCTEQTMSAFLPDVVVARALRDLDLPNERLERELPDMVQKGLNRLYGFQHDDGGWGWWRYDQSDPWMTAYVVFGLLTAKENGFPVNERFLSAGLGWLRRYAQQQPLQLSPERAYLVYVLAIAGRSEFASRQLTHLYRNLHSLNAHSTALLASALLAQQRTREARVAAARLWQQASETQALVSWEGMEGWGRGGSVETTALAFKALQEVSPDDPRLFKVVRWLVLHRQGNHWVSTRDTAFALYALTGFLKRSQELRPDYLATVTLNGRKLLSRQVTADDIFAPEIEVSASGAPLQIGDNTLEISKEGAGTLYYTLTLRQFVGQEDLTKVITGAGISVGRRYHSMVAARDPRTRVFAISPSPRPTTSFRSGESVLVRLTIKSPREYEYVVIEDPIPAGCEVAEQGDLEPWEWDRWWSDMDVRDEKVAFFARRLPAGTSTIEYHLRPQIPGEYHVMPTEVYAMYNPDLRGSGEETRVSLR